MVDVKNKHCIHPECGLLSLYNNSGEKYGIYCASHKLDDMIDVFHPRCLTHMCDVTGSKKYKGYCLRCYIYTFPDQPVSKNYKTKEKCVVDYVISTFPQYTWTHDRKIQDGCSRRRPDLLLDLGSQVLIVEIDENQHASYDCSCENKRLMEISQDVNHRPVVFIRFNPDEYSHNSVVVKSPWKNNGGICVIQKTRINEWNARLNVLFDTINYWSINTTNRTVEVVNLFFDS
jgi:hypothetical protein